MIDKVPIYGVLWDFLQAHMTYINRERRVNDDRVEGLNDLLNFTIENVPLLSEAGIIDDLRDITEKLLRANSETAEVSDDKLTNVTQMTERVQIEVDLIEAGEMNVR